MEQSRDSINGGPRPTGWQSATDVAPRDPWQPTDPAESPAAAEETRRAATAVQPQAPADVTQEQPAVSDTRALPFAEAPSGPVDEPPVAPAQPADRPKRRGAALVAAGLLVAALAGGAAGAAVTAALDDDSPQHGAGVEPRGQHQQRFQQRLRTRHGG